MQFLNVVGISIALMIGAGQALQGIQTSFAYYNQPGQTQDFFAEYKMYDFFDGNNYYYNPVGQRSGARGGGALLDSRLIPCVAGHQGVL